MHDPAGLGVERQITDAVSIGRHEYPLMKAVPQVLKGMCENRDLGI